ncbi:MAG: ChbG/HpnK family deacetylase [Pseudomonadota bacterium]
MTETTRLLVRVDDAGSSWASNLGCLRACTDGIARSVEVMMPGPWVPHAAQLFNAHPEIDIGIHLTLTSEWGAMKWRPLTQARSLTDAQGYFLPLVTARDDDIRPCLAEQNWSLDEVARELRAQVALGQQMFPGASHISTHMMRHFRDLDPCIGDVITEICNASGLSDDAFGNGLPRISGYPRFPREASARTTAFLKQISELAPGTHIFIDHPAVASPELEAIGHPGYEDVGADRLSCLATLTHPELRRSVDARGIELINYRDL